MHDPNRLQIQLVNMIAIEAAIEKNLEELIPKVSAHAEATALLNGFLTTTKAQRLSLENRLHTIANGVSISSGSTEVLASISLFQAAEYPISTALQIVYTIFHQAVISYSVMHSLSTRFMDGPYIADEGTSYHLARQHTQNYINSIQQIARLIHDVVIWELDEKGLECQCACPSCSAGICLCALAGRSFLRDSWEEAGPIANDEGVHVQLPKQNSIAQIAGLQRGDVILYIDDQEIETYKDLQKVVRAAKPGEEIKLMIRRSQAVTKEIHLISPG